jgi:phenylacetate-CoA ligase
MIYEIAKKFLRLSPAAERAALDICERLPQTLRYKVFYGTTFLRWMNLVKEAENWDTDRLYTYQFEQTKNLLTHSMKHVPFYRKLFRNIGFQPKNIQSLDDLRLLPYLTKEEIRDNPTEFVDESVPPRSLIRKPTGGSSGIPMTVYRTKDSTSALPAFRENILGRIGHTPKAREVMLWHYVQLGNKNVPFMRYGNRLVLSMRYLTVEGLLKNLDMIKKFEPEYILGYPSWLTILSTIIRDHNLPSFQSLKAIIPYSETLYKWQRELMEENFGSRIFSMYAMNELSAIGGECESSNSIHFHPLYGLIEFIDTIQGYKEIVATGFTNYAMPFIRYRTGDLVMGYADFCHICGRHHKIVETIEGRSHEFLVGRNNELIDIRPLWIASFPNILQCQFLQEEPGKVLLKIVPSKIFSKIDRSYIQGKLDEIVAPDKNGIAIELVITDHVERTSSGKINMIVQKLDVRRFSRLEQKSRDIAECDRKKLLD